MTEEDYVDTKKVIWLGALALALVIVLIMTPIFAWKLISPGLNLRASNTEKQAVIKEQEAISEAEVYAAEKRVIAAQSEADARIIEAESLAESQELIAETLTPEYLQWRLYEVLATTENQVIYVATEGGLPVTEASRLAEPIIVAPEAEE